MGDRELELTARVVRLELGYTTAPEELEDTVVDEVERIIPELNALQHHEGSRGHGDC